MSSTYIDVNNLSLEQMELYKEYLGGSLNAEKIEDFKNRVVKDGKIEEKDLEFTAALSNLLTEQTLKDHKNFEGYKEAGNTGFFNRRNY